MAFTFSEADYKNIAKTLGTKSKKLASIVRFEIAGKEAGRRIALELYSAIEIGKRKGTLVSVYTPNAHLQLHFCTGYVASTLLGEVTFVGESGDKLSGLTIEREGGCSLYANVDRSILSGDFTTLGPEVMLSGIALSLTESSLTANHMSEVEFENSVLRKTSRRPSPRARKRSVKK